MTEPAATPFEAPPPVLLTRTFRFAKRWLEGVGRRAGLVLALLPIAVVVGLFVLIFLTNNVCGLLLDFDTCVDGFNVGMRIGAIAALALAFLCVSTLIMRLLLLIRRFRDARQADEELARLRRQLPDVDWLSDPAYGPLHDQWRHGTGPDALYRKAATFLAIPTILLAATAVLVFFLTGAFFVDYGSLFAFESTPKAATYWLLEASLVLSILLTYRFARTTFALRRLARERRQDLERDLSAAEAAVLRRHHHPDAPDDAAPAFTFRAWNGPAPRSQSP